MRNQQSTPDMNSILHRQSSLDRSYYKYNGAEEITDDIYRQRLDDAYYLRRMRDILQDGLQPRPVFPLQMTQVCGHLFIGNQKNADDFEGLVARGITHVINCAPSRRRSSFTESPYPLETGIVGFKVIPADDKEDYEISKHFDETFAYLERVKQVKGKALVHCNMGVNRSGAITAAYVLASERRYLLEVITFLKDKRQVILTNKGFRRQLIRYARLKKLLDPISNSHYARQNENFEHLSIVDQQHAFSTPQLRRCLMDQKPPRSRQRNSRSRMSEADSHFDENGGRDFTVKSLPRNITRSRSGVDSQGYEYGVVQPNQMSRRSISYIVKEPDSFDNDVEKVRSAPTGFQTAYSRKSIALDHITIPISHTQAEASHHRHDDIPRLEIKTSPKGHFSSRYNLTITHPSENTSNDYERDTSSSPANHQDNSARQSIPVRPTFTSGNISEGKTEPKEQTAAVGAKNSYCRQIRQHFSELIGLMRPGSNKNDSETHASISLKSNHTTIPIFIQRSDAKPILSNDAIKSLNHYFRTDSNDVHRAIHSSTASPSKVEKCVAPFQRSNPKEAAELHLLDSKKTNSDAIRPYQLFSTKLSHVVRTRNQSLSEQSAQPPKGSLVHIGTRSSALPPQGTIGNYTLNKTTDSTDSSFPSTAPRRARRYIRSKTDSEVM